MPESTLAVTRKLLSTADLRQTMPPLDLESVDLLKKEPGNGTRVMQVDRRTLLRTIQFVDRAMKGHVQCQKS